MMTRFALLMSIPLFAIAVPAKASDYHFSPTGNDITGDGSQGNPYQSLAKLESLDLNPGDTVLLQRGGQWQGTLTFGPEDSGTSQTPVVVTAYGDPGLLKPTIVGPSDSFTNNAGWNRTCENCNSYYRTYSQAVSRCIEQNGAIIKRLVGAASPSAVESTPGSFFYDSANDVLWVHPYGSTDPRSDGKTYYAQTGAVQVVQFSASGTGADYIRLEQLTVGVGYLGITIQGLSNEGISISACRVGGCSEGITLAGSNIHVTDCDIRGCINGIGDFTGLLGSQLTIDYNTIAEGISGQDNEGIGLNSVNQVHIHHNSISDYFFGILIIPNLNDPIEDMEISHNTFHGTARYHLCLSQAWDGNPATAGFYFGDLSIHDNVFNAMEGGPGGGPERLIRIWRHSESTADSFPADPLLIYNNTLYGTNALGELGIRFETSIGDNTPVDEMTNVSIINNLFYAIKFPITGATATNAVIDFNYYYLGDAQEGDNSFAINGQSYTLTTWFTQSGYDSSGGKHLDPQFCFSGSNYYRLSKRLTQLGNKGTFVLPGNDYYGTSHSNPPCVGAAEEGFCLSP